MSFKSTFLALKKMYKLSKLGVGVGGEVTWIKSKRTAAFVRDVFPKRSVGTHLIKGKSNENYINDNHPASVLFISTSTSLICRALVTLEA